MKKSNYGERLKDPRWQKLRLKVFERDNWTCQICLCNSKTLNVHHRYYENGKEPWDYPLEALVTLCEDCHEEEKWKMKLALDMIMVVCKENLFAYSILGLTEAILRMPKVDKPDTVIALWVWAMFKVDIYEVLKRERKRIEFNATRMDMSAQKST